MIQHGTIVNVEVETLGAELSAAALTTDAVLNLRNTIDFTDLGGRVQLGSTDPVFATFHTYSEDAVDDEALTLTLDAPVGVAYPVNTFVYVSPAPVVRYWAYVQVDGDDDEVIIAEISRPLVAMIEQGIRDIEDQESSAILEERDGTWTVIDILGLEPVVVGAAIYVPNLDDPDFSVDNEGHLVAKSVEIEPKNDNSVPLIITDTLGTGTDWTRWLDSGGAKRLWVDNGGNLLTDGLIGWQDDSSTVAGVALSDGPISPSGAVEWSSGSGPFDVSLWRSGASELTLSEPDSVSPVDLVFEGGALLGVSRISLGDTAGANRDTRLRRSGTKELTLDDTTSGPADFKLVGGGFLGGNKITFADTGGANLDARIRRTGTKEITYDDASGGAADLIMSGFLRLAGSGFLEIAAAAAPAAPAPGRLRFYVVFDGSSHPQFRIRNSAGTSVPMTTFADGA